MLARSSPCCRTHDTCWCTLLPSAASLHLSFLLPPFLADAPKGLGTMLPAKKDKKEAAATSTLPSAVPGGSEAGAAAVGGGSTQVKAPKETQPMVRVEAKPLEVS
jgi:hypothetical protein